MKKTLLNLFFAALSVPAFSQVPNGSFENWQTENTYSKPISWSTSNEFYYALDQESQPPLFISSHPASVVKTTPGQSGTSAVTISNVEGELTFFGQPTSDTLPAFIILGEVPVSLDSDVESDAETSGLPYTGRPTALTGFYKFTQGAPATSNLKDTALIAIGLSKWNPVTKTRDEIGSGALQVYNNQSAFTSFTVPLLYESGSTPDTLVIFIISSNTEVSFPGTSITVDALALTGVTGIKLPFAATTPVQVYPNPATGNVNFKDLPNGTTSVEVKDLTGKSIMTVDVTSDLVNISTSDLPAGMYFYNAQNESGDVLYAGKFDVKN